MVKQILKRMLLPLCEGYFRLRMVPLVWRTIVNRKPRKYFMREKPELDRVMKRVLAEFFTEGIAITHCDEFLADRAFFPDMVKFMNTLKMEKENREEGVKNKVSKPFLVNLFEPTPHINFENPFHRFALHPRIVDIVNQYLGVYAKLYYLTLNVTVPVGEGSSAVASQRWHRDPEDRRMCKVFLYLNDVDENAGPFIYATKSCYGLKYGSLFPQKPPIGVYPDAAELEKRIVKDDIKICTRRAGTIIFCDTSGLHKGGFAKTSERIMFTAGYRTNGAVTPNRIRYPEGCDAKRAAMKFPPASEYAATPFTVSTLNRKLFSYTQRWKEELNGKNTYHEG